MCGRSPALSVRKLFCSCQKWSMSRPPPPIVRAELFFIFFAGGGGRLRKGDDEGKDSFSAALQPYLNTDDAGGEGFPRLLGAACL